MAQIPHTPQGSQQPVMSLEGIFITHLFSYIDRLQECWPPGSALQGGFDIHSFEHQILLLVRMIPDRKRQEEIMDAWLGTATEKYSRWEIEDGQMVAFRGMEAVTEIVMFICQAFDLVHTDVTGPATNKQYQKEAVAVGDMPVELVARIPSSAPITTIAAAAEGLPRAVAEAPGEPH